MRRAIDVFLAAAAAAAGLALPTGCLEAPGVLSTAARLERPGDAAALVVPTGPPIKIVSFNIRFDNPDDGVNAWPNRRPMVYQLLRELDADVAGLQEVLFGQLQDLAAALPEYQRVGVGRDDGSTEGEFSPILYRASRFWAESSGTFWFSDTPQLPGSRGWGNATTRICTWAHLVERASGRAYYHFNLHLDNNSQESREKSVVFLMEKIRARAVASDPFLVTGDFNVGEAAVAIHFMKGAAPLAGADNPSPMVDSFREHHPDETAVGTFHRFLGGTERQKLDYIFIRPGDRTRAAGIIHKQENGLYPSDHYPITATVDVAGW